MSKNRVRARSPLPDWVANMSPTDLQEKLGKKIPDGALSFADRFKRYWGVGKVKYRPNEKALRDAMYEYYDNSTAEQRAAEKLKAVEQIAAVKENIDKLNRYHEPYAAQAKQQPRPKGYPPFPITPEDIIDAKKQVQHIEMTYPRHDYGVYSNALKAARDRLGRLQRQFDEQERKYPGAYKYPSYNTESIYALPSPPLTQLQMSSYPRDSGGKSKRVKRVKRSKRSKTCKNRVHKRRN